MVRASHLLRIWSLRLEIHRSGIRKWDPAFRESVESLVYNLGRFAPEEEIELSVDGERARFIHVSSAETLGEIDLNPRRLRAAERKATRYFEEQVLRKRPYLERSWCDQVIAVPIRREVQTDGRIRFWGKIERHGRLDQGSFGSLHWRTRKRYITPSSTAASARMCHEASLLSGDRQSLH
jgi:hypothetical protein